MARCSGLLTRHCFTKSVKLSDHSSGFRNVGGGLVGIMKIAWKQKNIPDFKQSLKLCNNTSTHSYWRTDTSGLWLLKSLCQYYTQICSEGKSNKKSEFSHFCLHFCWSHYIPSGVNLPFLSLKNLCLYLKKPTASDNTAENTLHTQHKELQLCLKRIGLWFSFLCSFSFSKIWFSFTQEYKELTENKSFTLN